MARTRILHRCVECHATAPQWSGRCVACGAWNALREESSAQAVAGGVAAEPAVLLTELDGSVTAMSPSGIDELDRVLGGGLTEGSVTLLGGPPGIGKSTLLLQLAAGLARCGQAVLYVSAEESKAQVRRRAERLDAVTPGLWLSSELTLPAIRQQIAEIEPALVVVDSIQTVVQPDLGSTPGTVTQVRECANDLIGLAKSTGCMVVLVGHVTKGGDLAGPRVLEHLVDTVLHFDGDRHQALRSLRTRKHRFGASGELGLFQMTGAGMVPIPDASKLFLADRQLGIPGSAVAPVLAGDRALLVEIQTLLAPANGPTPRRITQGLDSARLDALVAVLHRRADVDLGPVDVYASAVGGIRVSEPAADLAAVLALASADLGRPVDGGLVVCGEVGLAGEVRQVGRLDERLAEAARLGFVEAVVPASVELRPVGLRLHRVGTVAEALAASGLTGRSSRTAGRPAA